jgi:tetratricopeptide (TPR) repeat protein
VATSFLVGADGPTTAYYQAQLASYRLEAGDVDAAVALAEDAVASDPASAVAHGVLGRVLAAAGRPAEAITAYQAAVAIVPSPKLVAALGDLYTATGQPTLAEEQYETVLVIAELASQDGAIVYDRDLARFLADHDRQLDRAVELARAELAVRPDAYGYDTLAWALHASGDTEGAVEAIAPALATGLVDAQVLYHAGVIRAAAGDDQAGAALLDQALAINPNFDPLHAPLAAERLAALQEVP